MRRYFFLTVQYQLINIQRIMEVEKSPFGKYHSTAGYRQKSSMDAKITGLKYEKKQNMCMVSKYFRTRKMRKGKE